MIKTELSDVGVEKLIKAIIKLAVKDYMRLYSSFLKEPDINAARSLKIQRRWFETNCSGLTSYGEAIAEKAESIVREKFSEELLYAADCMYNEKLANCA